MHTEVTRRTSFNEYNGHLDTQLTGRANIQRVVHTQNSSLMPQFQYILYFARMQHTVTQYTITLR